MNSPNNKEFLGRGAYGFVTLDSDDNRNVIKTFKYVAHAIQEYVGLKFINNIKYGTVEINGVDFYKKEIKMKKCNYDLRRWINQNTNATEAQKLSILKGAILGLCNLHHYGCLHGDLKPGNILVFNNETVLGDLGFFAPAKYSKCHLTAATYREPNVVHDLGHDLYALAIILLEIFGKWRHRRHPDTDSIRTAANRTVKNEKIKNIIMLLVSQNRQKRLPISRVYKILYGESPQIKEIDDSFNQSSIDSNKNINVWIRKTGDILKTNEIELGIDIVSDYLVRNKINLQLYQVYCATFIIILSSIYGYRPNFGVEHVLEVCAYKYKYPDITNILKSILSDDTVIKRLALLK